MANNKIVLVTPEKMAYMFLHNYFRYTNQTFFPEEELFFTMEDFIDFASKNACCVLMDEKENYITKLNVRKHIIEPILRDYVFEYKPPVEYGDDEEEFEFLCFEKEAVEKLRNSYISSSPEFKKLVIDYEKRQVEYMYSNVSELRLVDTLIEQKINFLKRDNAKKDKGESFDA